MRRELTLSALPVAILLVTVLAAHAQPSRPAPTEDRVGFPDGYKDSYAVVYTFDRSDNRQVRVVYGNTEAASAQPGREFPYGSILVMETYRAMVDDQSTPVLDASGRYQPNELTGIFVMRKEPGFGAEYGPQRNGEWEYVSFRPDGSYANEPANTNGCAACHADAGATRDWTWRTNLFFQGKSGAVPQPIPGMDRLPLSSMQAYLYLPNVNTIKAGSTFLWTNDDSAVHTVTANDKSFDSARLGPGATFSYRFDQPGTYEFSCTIHPSMVGRIVVEP
jgi:plastocyanin